MRKLGLLVVLLLAACGTAAPPTPDPAVIEEAVEATVAARDRAPVTLTTPDDGATFDEVARVQLAWDWSRDLREGEVYDVRVWREGEPHYGIAWTRDESFEMMNWLRRQEPGTFFWSVAVVRDNGEGGSTPVTDEAPPRSFTVEQIDLDIVDVPEGFHAALYSQPVASLPTQIEQRAEGMYMLTVDGDVLLLRDTDSDDFAETVDVVYRDADHDNQLNHAVGMAFDEDGTLYISDSGRVSTLTDADGDGVVETVTPIVEGLPTLQYPFHSNNGIVFGDDGWLYIAVGATTDHGPLQDEYEAAVLRVMPDGSDLEVFATGFRNPYDLTFSPGGDLFTADNSPDELELDLQYLPPEELNHVREGRDYGFPDTYGNLQMNGHQAEPPVTEFFTSVATSGLTYYAADAFPPAYRDGVYVAQFGTGAGAALDRSLSNGHMVAFVSLTPIADGTFTGTWQPFAQFDLSVGNFSPIDVTVGDDGALYIAEYLTAAVFRVTYAGERVEATPEATAEVVALDPVLALGEEVFLNGVEGAPNCVSCHALDGSVIVGPSLLGIADVAGERVPGLDAAEYVRQSIVSPNDYVLDGYNAGLMFAGYADALSDEQLDALVAYVLGLEG